MGLQWQEIGKGSLQETVSFHKDDWLLLLLLPVNFIQLHLDPNHGRSGHAVGDIPGVRFKVCKFAGVSILALYKEKKENPRS